VCDRNVRPTGKKFRRSKTSSAFVCQQHWDRRTKKQTVEHGTVTVSSERVKSRQRSEWASQPEVLHVRRAMNVQW